MDDIIKNYESLTKEAIDQRGVMLAAAASYEEAEADAESGNESTA